MVCGIVTGMAGFSFPPLLQDYDSRLLPEISG